MNGGAADGASMNGFGFALRFRPLRHFALEVSGDLVGGTDYQGYGRWEMPFSFSGMMYVNPRNATQLYFLAGLGWSAASVEASKSRPAKQYAYFGGHFGVGLEFRVTHLVSINTDLIGFARNRVDSGAADDPEFIDPETGAVTNNSGGGVLRAGVTLYW